MGPFSPRKRKVLYFGLAEGDVAKGKSFFGRMVSVLNWTVWTALILGLSIAFTPVTAYMLRPLLIKEEIRKADVIVVLGGGIDRGRYLSLRSSHRMVKGAQLFFGGQAKKMLFAGGAGKYKDVAEGSVMAQEARRLNVPAEDILVEKNSRQTYEQAAEIKKMADSLKWKSLILVTSLSHMKRAVLTFEHLGFKVYPAPADPYEKYLEDPWGRLTLFPQLIHEYIAFIYYKVRGWL